VVKMARASMLARDLRIPRDVEVGRSEQGEQSPLRRTYETTQAPWSSESRHPSRGGGGTKVLVSSGKIEERLQPLLGLGADDIGCSESREEGNTRYTASSEHR
jgi:hypothetical protein